MTGKQFKEKLYDYLMQRSTWLGLGSAVIVVLSNYRPESVPVVAGVMTAMGLIVNDRKK